MITMKAINPIKENELINYEIYLDKAYTIKDFIDSIFIDKSYEWGNLEIYSKEFISGNPHCEYKYGEIINEAFPKDILEKQIIKVTANGSWSRMDYLFWI